MPASTVKPVAGLPDSEPGAYREHLMLDAGLSTGNRVGRDLVLGTTPPSAVATSGAKAANAIVQLRRLDDTLPPRTRCTVRFRGDGVAMGEVMALYRVEGDMQFPPSEASLAANIPSGRTDAASSLAAKPDISHLVLMLNPL